MKILGIKVSWGEFRFVSKMITSNYSLWKAMDLAQRQDMIRTWVEVHRTTKNQIKEK